MVEPFKPLLPHHMKWLLTHPHRHGDTYPLQDGRTIQFDGQTGDLVIREGIREIARIPTRVSESV